jgi:hypothetical protein
LSGKESDYRTLGPRCPGPAPVCRRLAVREPVDGGGGRIAACGNRGSAGRGDCPRSHGTCRGTAPRRPPCDSGLPPTARAFRRAALIKVWLISAVFINRHPNTVSQLHSIVRISNNSQRLNCQAYALSVLCNIDQNASYALPPIHGRHQLLRFCKFGLKGFEGPSSRSIGTQPNFGKEFNRLTLKYQRLRMIVVCLEARSLKVSYQSITPVSKQGLPPVVCLDHNRVSRTGSWFYRA